MSTPKKVIVLGAGASKEAGLPTGQELKEEIVNFLNFRLDKQEGYKRGEGIIFDALKLARKENKMVGIDECYLDAATIIRKAMPQAKSIDSFIDAHRGNESVEMCGKLAIVHRLSL